MADSTVPIQPAGSPTPAAAPVLVKTFQQLDELGNVVQIQAVMLVDEFGRFKQPLTEDTGRAILAAIRELHTAFVDTNGGTYPSASPTISE